MKDSRRGQDPGEPIDASQAAEMCLGIPPRLRAQIDPDTIEALDALIAEGTVSLPANKALAETFTGEPGRLPAGSKTPLAGPGENFCHAC